MKLTSLNSRESCHVFSFEEWEILFCYGSPVFALYVPTGEGYQTNEPISLATQSMITRYKGMTKERLEIVGNDIRVSMVPPDQFESFIFED
jgi:hypothetical protein